MVKDLYIPKSSPVCHSYQSLIAMCVRLGPLSPSGHDFSTMPVFASLSKPRTDRQTTP